MPNAKLLICAMLTAVDSNQSSVSMLHIYAAVPHVCSILHCAVQYLLSSPLVGDINPKSSN